MECPNCGLENPPIAQRCDCGYDFPSREMKGSYLTPKQQEERTWNARRLWSMKMPSEDYARRVLRQSVGLFAAFVFLLLVSSPSQGSAYLVLASLVAAATLWLYTSNSRTAASILVALTSLTLLGVVASLVRTRWGGGLGLVVLMFWVSLQALAATRKLAAR
jgi:hypothetical protein